MTYRKSEGVEGALRRIAMHAELMSQARDAAERILKVAEHLLVGKRFEPSKSGNLKGSYEITSVSIEWDGRVRSYGRKVLSNGKLGSRSWDLGTINIRTAWV